MTGKKKTNVTNIPSAANLGLENHKIHCIRGREEEKEKLQLSF
jgi:hypothetical protein